MDRIFCHFQKKSKESKRRKDPVDTYVKSLIKMWSKAVANNMRNGLALHFNKIYNSESQLSR